MYFTSFVEVLRICVVFNALLCVPSSSAIILKRKRKLVALLLLSYRYIVTINVLWFFLTLPCVGSQYVIVAFPDHSHLLFDFLLGSELCGSRKSTSIVVPTVSYALKCAPDSRNYDTETID